MQSTGNSHGQTESAEDLVRTYEWTRPYAMDDLEPQPAHPLPQIKAVDPQRLAKAVGNHKAPGLSSWRPQDLKSLPPLALRSGGDLQPS